MSYYISQETATIMAIVFGPVLAVIVSLGIEHIRDKRRRKLKIYYEIMKRRDEPLTEVAWALNLIHVEFYNKKKVIKAWEDLFNHLRETPPSVGKTDEEIKEARRKKRKKKDRLLATLLQEMSKDLGFKKSDHRFISETVYDPKGKEWERWMKMEIRQRTIDFLSGKAPIAIKKIKTSSDSSNKSDISDKIPKSNEDL